MYIYINNIIQNCHYGHFNLYQVIHLGVVSPCFRDENCRNSLTIKGSMFKHVENVLKKALKFFLLKAMPIELHSFHSSTLILNFAY